MASVRDMMDQDGGDTVAIWCWEFPFAPRHYLFTCNLTSEIVFIHSTIMYTCGFMSQSQPQDKMTP